MPSSNKYKYTLRGGKIYISKPKSKGGSWKPQVITLKEVRPFRTLPPLKKGEMAFHNSRKVTNKVMKECKIPRPEATRIINHLKAVMIAALRRGETIAIPRFGKFSVRDRKEHQHYHPKHKTFRLIPASKKVYFTPYDSFKKLVMETTPGYPDESQS